MHVTITAEGVGTGQGGSDGSDSESNPGGDDPFARETGYRGSFTLQRIEPNEYVTDNLTTVMCMTAIMLVTWIHVLI